MPFSIELAKLTVELARLAYEEPTIIDQGLAGVGLRPLAHFDEPNTQAFMAQDDMSVYLSFRGTQEPTDWLTNAKFLPTTSELGVKVHSGFVDALDEVWAQIESRVVAAGLPVTVTGHSLGAALASLAALRLAKKDQRIAAVYTYGQPRTGHSSFRKLYNSVLGSDTYRFVNHIDLVTRVPLLLQGYQHVGTRMYFDGSEKFHADASFWRIARDDLTYRLSHFGKIDSIGIKPHLIKPYASLINTL